MFKLLMPIPHAVHVAVSGGPDSMAALDFLCHGNRNVVAVHYNHGTDHGKEAEAFVVEQLGRMGIACILGRNTEDCPKGMSRESFWRDKRYGFFKEAVGDLPLVLAHTLNDAMETWVFTSLHGNPRVIPARRGNILRPFLLCRKSEMMEWCVRKEVPFIIDPGNSDRNYARVRIRMDILPELLKVNPGFFKTVAKMYLKQAGR